MAAHMAAQLELGLGIPLEAVVQAQGKPLHLRTLELYSLSRFRLDVTEALRSEASTFAPHPARQSKKAAPDDDGIKRVNAMVGNLYREMLLPRQSRARTLNLLSLPIDGYTPPGSLGTLAQ